MIKKIVRRFLNKLGYEVTKRREQPAAGSLPVDFDQRVIDTYYKVKAYTMTSPERIASLCNAVNYLVKNNIEGDFVECGVWKGGSTMAAIDTLIKLDDTGRDIYLYDTFDGMPEPTATDKEFTGIPAVELLQGSEKDNAASVWCYSSLNEVQQNVAIMKYPASKLHFIKGKVEDTIPKTVPKKIALLRLDTDWYESTAHELKHLYPLLVPGGIIIIDDYGHWEGARKAVDEYIETGQLPLLLNRIDYTGRIGVKP